MFDRGGETAFGSSYWEVQKTEGSKIEIPLYKGYKGIRGIKV